MLELLVVSGVLAVLVGLLLPAVQQSRERARNIDCRNRLRQLGVASQAFHGNWNSFPRLFLLQPLNSPHRQLLPYLDLETVFKKVDWRDMSVDLPNHPPEKWSTSSNLELMRLTLPVFLCPSDAARAGATNYRACTGYGPGVFAPNSPSICNEPGNATGAFVHGRVTRAGEFRDGLSHTALFSERALGDYDRSTYRPFTDVFFYEGDGPCTVFETENMCRHAHPDAMHDSFGGATWLYGGWHRTLYNHLAGPNSRMPDCSAGGEISLGGGDGSYAARSYHTGGVNVVLADGSARFVNEGIALPLWRALSTRDGKEGSHEF